MARKMTHIGYGAATGALIGLGLGFYDKYKSGGSQNRVIEYILIGMVSGAVTSMLPDIIEPANNNPFHRGFAHSILFGSIILSCLGINFPRLLKGGLFGLVVASGSGGYISHLALDSTTPARLPIISNTF